MAWWDADYRTTAKDVIQRYHVDLTGKTALITGCTSGIGVDTARALAHANATLFIAGRNATTLTTTRDQLNAELKQAGKAERVHSLLCDLSELPSVRLAAAEFLSHSSALHLLVCNAGLMALRYRTSPAGADMQFAVNHIGHQLLFTLLQPALLASAPSRVVVVSSGAHTWGAPRIDYTRLPSTPASSYSPWGAYQQSKLANILFALEIHHRFSTQGLTAYSLHPGAINTGLQEEVQSTAMHFVLWLFARAFKTIPQGAATSVYCAAAPGLEAASGQYFNNCKLTEAVEKLQLAEDEPKRLWEWTEQFIAQHSTD